MGCFGAPKLTAPHWSGLWKNPAGDRPIWGSPWSPDCLPVAACRRHKIHLQLQTAIRIESQPSDFHSVRLLQSRSASGCRSHTFHRAL